MAKTKFLLVLAHDHANWVILVSTHQQLDKTSEGLKKNYQVEKKTDIRNSQKFSDCQLIRHSEMSFSDIRQSDCQTTSASQSIRLPGCQTVSYSQTTSNFRDIRFSDCQIARLSDILSVVLRLLAILRTSVSQTARLSDYQMSDYQLFSDFQTIRLPGYQTIRPSDLIAVFQYFRLSDLLIINTK